MMKKLKLTLVATTGLMALALSPVMANERGGYGGQRGEVSFPITLESYLERHETMFDRLDADGDGIITRAEIVETFAARSERRAERMADRILSRAEASEAGEIARDDFLARAEVRFASLDTDGDGSLSREEMRAAYGDRQMRRGGGRKASGQERRISEEAFLERRGQMFDRIDADGDGIITPEEMEAHFARVAERMQNRFVERVGADADGNVSREAFDQMASASFSRLDRNDDGYINSREMRRGPHGHRGGNRGWGNRGNAQE